MSRPIRLHVMHEDTSFALFLKEYERTRTAEGPLTKEEVKEAWDRYDADLERMVPRLVPSMIEDIQSSARANAQSHQQIQVAAAVEQRWGAVFRPLQDLIKAFTELTHRFVIRLEHTPREDLTDLHVVRTVLCIRAVQTAQAIEVLLRGGHSAAAWAQWRILHELAVVAKFVSKHGERVATAYLNHGVEQSYRTLKAYKDHYKSMAGSEQLAQMLSEHGEWKRMLESEERYGNHFGATYGWAATALKKKRPDFIDLERDADMSVARPQYQIASNVVHPGVRGLLDHHDDESGETPAQPWAPHASHLGEPLANTAKTLTALTGGLIDMECARSDLVLMQVIIHFRDEVVRKVYPPESLPSSVAAASDG